MTDFWNPAAEPPTELGRYRVLSSTASVRVSPLQLGAMSIGEAWKGALGTMDKEASFALLDAFYEAGGNFIDTANNYQEQDSERWLGEWMEARGNRDSLVVATKYTNSYRTRDLGKTYKAANFAGNSRHSLHVSVRDSLAKLRTDYIDILYVHWWDQVTSIKEIMDSLHMLVEQGTVLYLGVSDTPAWFVAAANQYALDHGKTPFSIYQGRWNVMLRDFERDILPMARHYGMALAPWDVLGGGKFQTAAALAARRAAGEGLRSLTGPSEQTADEARMSEALARVAAEHGTESVTAVALAYVLAKAPRVFPIVGGRRVEHLRDNLQALSIRLTPAQIAALEAVRPFDPGFPTTMLGPDPNVVGYNPLINLTNPMAFPNARQETSLADPAPAAAKDEATAPAE